MDIKPKHLKKPEWLRIQLTKTSDYNHIKGILSDNSLHTICESGNCPNKAECWAAGTFTFMILGNICTRSCRFCNVKTGKPLPVDENEPLRVAETVKNMNTKHCVLTSVDRDDLPDGGAYIWSETIKQIRKLSPQTTIETLIPDFKGQWENLQMVLDAQPEIISHNLETVRRLTKEIRIYAKYDLSLEVLARIAKSKSRAKSGIMLGLGETKEEVLETMDDLLKVNCKIMTIGQYLQPSAQNYPVQKYVTPEEFEELRQIGVSKGFDFIESSPLVRSSYHAEKHI